MSKQMLCDFSALRCFRLWLSRTGLELDILQGSAGSLAKRFSSGCAQCVDPFIVLTSEEVWGRYASTSLLVSRLFAKSTGARGFPEMVRYAGIVPIALDRKMSFGGIWCAGVLLLAVRSVPQPVMLPRSAATSSLVPPSPDPHQSVFSLVRPGPPLAWRARGHSSSSDPRAPKSSEGVHAVIAFVRSRLIRMAPATGLRLPELLWPAIPWPRAKHL